MDDASSVFDASILTGPIANYPVADSFNPHARARLLDRRHPARLRLVGRLGSAVRARAARTSSHGMARRDRQRLDGDVASSRCSRACRSPSRRRRTSTRSPASACSGRTSSAIPTLPPDERTTDTVVQHGGVRRRAAVHARLGVAQPGARPVVSQRRSRADAARAGRRDAGHVEAARGDLQPAEHPAVSARRAACSARRTSARSSRRSIRASCSSP